MSKETYAIDAFILSRKPFKEFDDRIEVFGAEIGLKSLVVRGTKKPLSKLSGHIEPLTRSSLMVVRGKQYDYAGTAVSRDCYKGIKDDYSKAIAAGAAAKIFVDFLREGSPDKGLYDLLRDYLVILDACRTDEARFLKSIFIFRFFQEMGQLPDFGECAICGCNLFSTGGRFVGVDGGVVCGDCCLKKGYEGGYAIGGESIRLLIHSLARGLETISSDGAGDIREINGFADYYLEVMKEK